MLGLRSSMQSALDEQQLLWIMGQMVLHALFLSLVQPHSVCCVFVHRLCFLFPLFVLFRNEMLKTSVVFRWFRKFGRNRVPFQMHPPLLLRFLNKKRSKVLKRVPKMRLSKHAKKLSPIPNNETVATIVPEILLSKKAQRMQGGALECCKKGLPKRRAWRFGDLEERQTIANDKLTGNIQSIHPDGRNNCIEPFLPETTKSSNRLNVKQTIGNLLRGFKFYPHWHYLNQKSRLRCTLGFSKH